MWKTENRFRKWTVILQLSVTHEYLINKQIQDTGKVYRKIRSLG